MIRSVGIVCVAIVLFASLVFPPEATAGALEEFLKRVTEHAGAHTAKAVSEWIAAKNRTRADDSLQAILKRNAGPVSLMSQAIQECALRAKELDEMNKRAKVAYIEASQRYHQDCDSVLPGGTER